MVNQSKNFPSFSDVLDTVEKSNDKYKLNLGYKQKSFLSLFKKQYLYISVMKLDKL